MLFNEKDISIGFLTESWLNSKIYSSEIHINDYKIIRCDRQHKKCGGIIAYIHKSLTFNVEESYTTPEFELLHLSIDISLYKSFQFICLYKPPDIKLTDFLIQVSLFFNNF